MGARAAECERKARQARDPDAKHQAPRSLRGPRPAPLLAGFAWLCDTAVHDMILEHKTTRFDPVENDSGISNMPSKQRFGPASVILVVGFIVGVGLRLSIDDAAERDLANYVRGGVHESGIAFAAWIVQGSSGWSKVRWPLTVAAVSPLQIRAAAEDDVFQLAINYVFTGRIDPPDRPEIVDRKSCIVVTFDSRFQTYIRYNLKRFKMDTARISKTYSGQQIFYVLEVE